MRPRKPLPLNKAGRPIWFVRPPDGETGVTPVTREGWRTMGLGCLWIQVCGTVFPVIGVMTMDWRWLIVTFVVGGAGLLIFARTVRRHL